MGRVRIAVAGAGVVGKRHIEEVDASDSTQLSAIVDSGPSGPELAQKFNVAWYRSLAELFEKDTPDGVILATPNRLRVRGGLECVGAGVPVIVEKPLSDSIADATGLVEAGERAGVPVLTGHHRNYGPIMATARRIIQSGRLGRIVAVNGTALFYKPDGYFDAGGGWRRELGGGPILINLTHDLNSLLSLIGDVVRVQATTSNAIRGFPVEDTVALVLTFANGALGTFLLSDTAASARSWEQTSRENVKYANYEDEDAYHIAGTIGSLSEPTMRVKVFAGRRSWVEPFDVSTETFQRSDPLANQVTHFAAVIRGEAHPICSGRDGLATLRVVEAVAESARTGRPVDIPVQTIRDGDQAANP